jgi:hypothetical protein
LWIHDHCKPNRDGLGKSSVCGCFHCCTTYPAAQIKDWIDPTPQKVEEMGVQGQTAPCPRYGIDSLIGDQSGHPIMRDFLEKMRSYWLQGFTRVGAARRCEGSSASMQVASIALTCNGIRRYALSVQASAASDLVSELGRPMPELSLASRTKRNTTSRPDPPADVWAPEAAKSAGVAPKEH